MEEAFEIITVDAENVDQHGFFCYMSKRKAPGYTQKCEWLEARFAEGLKLHMVHKTGGRTVMTVSLLAYLAPVIFDKMVGYIGFFEILEHLRLVSMVFNGVTICYSWHWV